MIEESRERILKALASISLVFLVVIGLFFVVRSLPFEILGEVRQKRIPWWTLPLLAGLQIVFLFLAAEIWRQLVQVSTKSQVALFNAYIQLASVSIGKYVPGKVWGFVARTSEMYRQQIPVHLSVMSSIVEQLLLMIGALLVVVATSLIALPQYWVVTIVIGTALLLFAIVVTIKVPAVTLWIMRKRKMKGIPDHIEGYRIPDMIKYVLGNAVLWVLNGLIFSTIYFSLFDVTWSQEIMAALTLANTIGIVFGFFAIFVPGGIGVREAIVTGILSGFVPIHEALLAAVCYRAWMILVDGMNALLILGREVKLASSSSPRPIKRVDFKD